MKGAHRRAKIGRLLQERPASVEELARLYAVSPSTIRRDLATLSAGGQVVRTYGGALAPTPGEQSVAERGHLAVREKRAIAKAAVRHVQEGEFLLLDAGTTVGALAHQLRHGQSLTVATNGVTSVRALMSAAPVELLVIGGALRRVSEGMIGPVAEAMVSGLSADAVFLGADGVTADRGLCEGTAEQIALKRLMVERSSRVYVLADSTKLGNRGSHWWLPLSRPWTLITDSSASEEQLAPFRARGEVTLEVADAT
jgi:DeoR/GlpR family transcriptional regulator of sugar metabolism